MILRSSEALVRSHVTNYRFALSQEQPERILYLAVPLDTHNTFFKLPFTQAIIQENKLRLLIYDVQKEDIFQWIN